MHAAIPTTRRGALSGGMLALGAVMSTGMSAGMGGCQTNTAADVVNKTPQPLFVQLFIKGTDDATLGASKRLGPGDRGFIGPVRHDKNRGAYLAFDTLGNPTRPVTLDIAPGTNFFEVQQDSADSTGRLIIIQK